MSKVNQAARYGEAHARGMKMRRARLAPLAVALAACAAVPGAFATSIPAMASSTGSQAVCTQAASDSVTCFARVKTINGIPASSAAPTGYGPIDIQSAYNLGVKGGSGQTVGIVDAFDDPNAEADLGVYRATYGLPPCTTANGCFRKVNGQGVQGDYPTPDKGWSGEITLDLDMVSATCPNCTILLVEATNANWSAIGEAVNTAAALGANEISNSYGGSATMSTAGLDSTVYNHPGIALVASAGDSGYGTAYPAVSPNVTSVGGTSLLRDSSHRGWSETVWTGTGSGCSTYEPKPAWQSDKGCANRTDNDVAAVADPNTGVAVYDTYKLPGWMVFGGTSVGSPIIASIYALAGNAASQVGASSIYANTSKLYDITSGSDGKCSLAYLCTAEAGYDGPTGNGTPNGTGAF